MKKITLPKQLYFLPGVCWGGLLIRELLTYPELWFFASCAAGAGAGFLLIRLLPEYFRNLAGMALLILAALMWRADWYSAVFPFALGAGCANTLCRPADEWVLSRRLCGGMLLGAVLSVLPWCSEGVFTTVLLICMVLTLSGRFLRLLWLTAIIAGVYLLHDRPREPEIPQLRPGAVISAFSLITPAQEVPRVILTGGKEFVMRRRAAEIVPAAEMDYAATLSGRRQKADLIIAGSLPPISDGGIKALSAAVHPNGLLVIPVEFCGALPEWKWFILPGSNGTHAVGSAGKVPVFDPDKMDEKFISFFGKSKDFAPLAGALSGGLAGESMSRVENLYTWHNYRREIWILASAVLLLIMGGYTLYRRSRQPDGEYLRIMCNCGGYAFTAALFLPVVLQKIDLPVFPQLLVMLTVLWFLRRPAENRKGFARIMGGMSIVALVLAAAGAWWLLLAALICGGYACAQLDNELRHSSTAPVEPLRFMAIAIGVVAAWLCALLPLPEYCLPLLAAGVRFYSWFRN